MLRGLISRLRIKPPLGVALCFMLSVILVKSFNLVILFESNIMLIHSPTPTFNCNYINSSCKNKQKNLSFIFFYLQGLKLLSALLQYQKNLPPHCYILSLDLRGFFSTTVPVHLNPNMPHILEQLQGLTNLGLSYSCLSDELLIALQQRQGGRRWNSGRDGSILRTFSLHCTRNEPHQQVGRNS